MKHPDTDTKAPVNLKVWLGRADEADKQVEFCRKQVKAAKAQFKHARKALKEAKKSAKEARKLAKVAAKKLKVMAKKRKEKPGAKAASIKLQSGRKPLTAGATSTSVPAKPAVSE